MELLSYLDITFFLLAAIGALIGIIFGAIPGMTATMAVAVCLPLTYALGLEHGLALLLGLYVGGISGGMVPAVLLNIPGTPSSITTTFDGYPMAQKGQGEKALRVCVVASLVGGLVSALVLFFFAPLLAEFSIKFSYVEKFLIILLALTVIASMSSNMLIGIFSGVLGIWLSLIGTYSLSDGGNGKTRLMFDFMQPYLVDGFALLPVLIGIFGISTILLEAEKGVKSGLSGAKIEMGKGGGFTFGLFKGRLTNLMRSSFIGTFVGMLPGVGGSAASVLAYTQEKNLSRDSSQMGKGAPQGLIASESANNALTGGALIPLLSLGIPGDSTTAVLIGAFTLQGIQVGPLFIPENQDTWTVMMIALVFANIVMFFLMFYAIKYIARVVLVPKYVLYPIIVMMCVVGAYAINYGIMFDVWTLLIFGIFGYLIEKIGLEVAPLIIGFILGSSAEVYFVKSLESFGTFSIFFTKSPIALVLWGLIAASIAFSIVLGIKTRARQKMELSQVSGTTSDRESVMTAEPRTNESRVIRVHPGDNVAIVVGQGGLPRGTQLDDGVALVNDIPQGHKVALADIAEGERILRYNEVIGTALSAIPRGGHVNENNVRLPIPPKLDELPLATRKAPVVEPLEGYTFEGFRNPDGSVGTRNVLGITTSVQCVAGTVDHVVAKIKRELLPRFPNVDDVVGLNHSYGCGVAIGAPAAIVPIRTLRNLALNPNFGGEVMVIGLGCEKLQPSTLIEDRPVKIFERSEDASSVSANDDANVLSLQHESFEGFGEMVDGIMAMAERHLERLNRRRRETCPVSELTVGMQCGGSDAFSGVTANPAVGFATDLIVRAGGSVMFSEVTEVRDAIHLLTPRAVDEEVARALIEQMAWYDDYLAQGQADRSANPSPGNKKGGLSNIVEKALGSVIKSGNSPIVDVIGPGERLRKRGLTFAATPASDFICGTLQAAAGMNLQVFTTGRGTPYNLAMTPVIKVSTNSTLGRRWHDLIDLDAGRIATGEASIEDVGWELFELILEVASGRYQVAADRLGLYNDLVLFNPAPVT